MTVTVPEADEVVLMVAPELAQTAVVVVEDVTVKVPFKLAELAVEPLMMMVEPTGGAHAFGELGRLPEVEVVAAVKVTVRTPAELVAMPVAPTVKVTGP
jgi:hypothetical protein